ncbi:hypothetical protein [Natronobiforma cellulositropha]|uniref:hypothetical protein n=1 Tax=Natronobiforma cellulositropha TaxID=1679076 RepID=UPI0021D5AB08|nr:hypothetical protein [Natronobiforma cellulositropha]
MTDEEEWTDPVLESREVDRTRLAVRLACSFATLLVLVVLTRGFLAEATAALWPPTEPTTQWLTLVSLHAFAYVLVPLLVGSFVADVALERVRA